MAEPKNHAQTISELTLAAGLAPVLIPAAEGREYVALPTGNGAYKLEQITSPNKAEVLLPKSVIQHVQLQTTSSMIEYVNRFKNADTVLFADINSNSILAILDYHNAPEANLNTAGKEGVNLSSKASAQLNTHRAQLHLPFSQEWITWSDQSGSLLSHVDFATFIEENGVDVVVPDGASLLEMCRDLQVKAGMKVNSSIRHGDTTNFEFQKGDDVTTKENMQLPVSITLQIPVYFGEESVSINAFIRRKVIDGRLMLGFVLSRAENIRQAEFQKIVGDIEINVHNLTTVYGNPS